MILWPEPNNETHRTEIIGAQRWNETTRFHPHEQTWKIPAGNHPAKSQQIDYGQLGRMWQIVGTQQCVWVQAVLPKKTGSQEGFRYGREKESQVLEQSVGSGT